MDLPVMLLVCISLAIDCFAVSLAAASTMPSERLRIALVFGVSFGVFQTMMMIIGWYAGAGIVGLVSRVSPFVAFSILSLIGGKMIYEGAWGDDVMEERDYFAVATILVLSIATSIDSLGVGLSLAFIDGNILIIAGYAGIFSFLFACAGAFLGGILARKYGERFEILGGIILIGIGIWILLEHAAPLSFL